jgi:hypothetical protein
VLNSLDLKIQALARASEAAGVARPSAAGVRHLTRVIDTQHVPRTLTRPCTGSRLGVLFRFLKKSCFERGCGVGTVPRRAGLPPAFGAETGPKSPGAAHPPAERGWSSVHARLHHSKALQVRRVSRRAVWKRGPSVAERSSGSPLDDVATQKSRLGSKSLKFVDAGHVRDQVNDPIRIAPLIVVPASVAHTPVIAMMRTCSNESVRDSAKITRAAAAGDYS